MATIKHQCPHCRTQDIALVVAAWTPSQRPGWMVAHLACPRCHLPSAAVLNPPASGGVASHQLPQYSGDPTHAENGGGWRINEFWPSPPAPEIPELLPPEIVRVYLQAERNFPIEGNEEAAGTMYRKALDVGLKKVDPTLKGTLGTKITALEKAGRLTPEIIAWSKEVRDLGNDAAHEETPPTRPELVDLRAFTEMVLRYLFTLPNMVKKRRGEKLPWET